MQLRLADQLGAALHSVDNAAAASMPPFPSGVSDIVQAPGAPHAAGGVQETGGARQAGSAQAPVQAAAEGGRAAAEDTHGGDSARPAKRLKSNALNSTEHQEQHAHHPAAAPPGTFGVPAQAPDQAPATPAHAARGAPAHPAQAPAAQAVAQATAAPPQPPPLKWAMLPLPEEGAPSQAAADAGPMYYSCPANDSEAPHPLAADPLPQNFCNLCLTEWPEGAEGAGYGHRGSCALHMLLPRHLAVSLGMILKNAYLWYAGMQVPHLIQASTSSFQALSAARPKLRAVV